MGPIRPGTALPAHLLADDDQRRWFAMTSPAYRIIVAIIAALAATLITSSCSQNPAGGGSASTSVEPRELVFAALPSTQVPSLRQYHQAVMDMLEKETHLPVRFET